jgi:hypothetical protein
MEETIEYSNAFTEEHASRLGPSTVDVTWYLESTLTLLLHSRDPNAERIRKLISALRTNQVASFVHS